jgi:hypothetical protein
VLVGKRTSHKPGARLIVAVFTFLSAVVAAAGSQAEPYSLETASAQISSRRHDGAELISPQQAPLFRMPARTNLGLRGKAPAKNKPLALAGTGPSRLPSGARAQERGPFVGAEPQGFLLLRTQNPRAPPFSLILASHRLA